MNAIELFHQDGKSAKVFYCEKCRIVAPTQDQAEQCCRPYKCDMCGGDTEKHYTRCQACRDKVDAQREHERFEKAEKITEWGDPVFSDSVNGPRDGFFVSIDEMFDFCADDEINPPDYVWASKTNHFANTSINSIIEDIDCNGHEDFDPECLKGVDELKKAIEIFNAANEHICSYEPDYTKAILIQKPTTNS
jgi:hypothetical protein